MPTCARAFSARAAASRRPKSVQLEQIADPLEARHVAVEHVLFGAHAEPAVDGRVVPRVFAEDLHAAERRAKLPGNQVQERTLARAVGPQQPVGPPFEPERDVVHADDGAIEFRNVVELDHGLWCRRPACRGYTGVPPAEVMQARCLHHKKRSHIRMGDDTRRNNTSHEPVVRPAKSTIARNSVAGAVSNPKIQFCTLPSVW